MSFLAAAPPISASWDVNVSASPVAAQLTPLPGIVNNAKQWMRPRRPAAASADSSTPAALPMHYSGSSSGETSPPLSAVSSESVQQRPALSFSMPNMAPTSQHHYHHHHQHSQHHLAAPLVRSASGTATNVVTLQSLSLFPSPAAPQQQQQQQQLFPISPIALHATSPPQQQQQQHQHLYRSPSESAAYHPYQMVALQQRQFMSASPSSTPTYMDMGQYAAANAAASTMQSDVELLSRACVNVRRYGTDQQLCGSQLSRHLSVSELVGVEELCARVLDPIYRSITRSDAQVGLYLNSGRVYVCRALPGRGVRTAVTSFCAERHVNLVIIDGKVPPTDESDRATMRWIKANQPCILLVHRLDGRWPDKPGPMATDAHSHSASELSRLLALWQAQSDEMPMAWMVVVHQGASAQCSRVVCDYPQVVIADAHSPALVLTLMRRVTEWHLRLVQCSDIEVGEALGALDAHFAQLSNDVNTFATHADVVRLLTDAFVTQRNRIAPSEWTTHSKRLLVLTPHVLNECYRAHAEKKSAIISQALLAQQEQHENLLDDGMHH